MELYEDILEINEQS